MPQFVRAVYGDFALGTPIYAWFADAPEDSAASRRNPVKTPDPKDDALTNFPLESKPKSGPFTATLDQDWVVKTDWGMRVKEGDNFHAKLRHYELDDIKPPTPYVPDYKHDVTWQGSHDVREISLKFDYEFGSVLSLVRLLFTSPFDLVPAGDGQTLFYYIRGMLLAIPLV